jgi:hypothetical protein
MELTASDQFVLLLGPGVEPLEDAFKGLPGALNDGVGVLGGATHADGMRRFGWMLGPAAIGPLPFELVPIEAATGEAGADALVRGPIDVVAPEMMLVRRELLTEPLPTDRVAASLALTARARAARLQVVCRPSFACKVPNVDADDRGRITALRELARAHHDLVGLHRAPSAARHLGIDRETRVSGTAPIRVRRRIPATTVLVYGSDAAAAARRMRDRSPAIVAARAVDDPAAALRTEMRVRGDRYVLVADAAALPDARGFAALVETIESAEHIALAAPDAFDGRCVLIAVGRFPQHVSAAGETIGDALASLVRAAHALRRGVRPYRPVEMSSQTPRSVSLVFLAGSGPEVAKMSFDAALASTRPGDDVAAVYAAGAETTERVLRVYGEVQLEPDSVDPLLTDGTNRAMSAANGDLVVILADDIVVPSGWLDTLRTAFARIPTLGGALPCVNGAMGGEGVHDVSYTNFEEMRAYAQRRALAFARETERIDDAATPAIALAREALTQVGGIDPAFGPTRRGIGDLVLRLRAAGYEVVRCDDSYVHRLEPEQSRNVAALSPNPPGAPDGQARAAAIAAGFDPSRRVAFVARQPVRERVAPTTAVVVAISDAVELARAETFLASAAKYLDVTLPVRVHILIDGPIPTNDILARVRSVLARSGRSMEQTVAVRVERCEDLGAWTAAAADDLRLLAAAGQVRPAFAELPSIVPHALGELFRPVGSR